MKKLLFVILSIVTYLNISAQQRTISYYQSAVHTNSPEIKENINFQKFNFFQNEQIKMMMFVFQLQIQKF